MNHGFLGIDSYEEFLSDVLIPWAPILLLTVIVYFMYRTLKLMPRTKPQEISPRSKSSITWDDVAGAEQLTFGRVTTGAADDLKRVSAIARSMVHDYAMGTTIRSHQVPADDLMVSESLRQTRDEEVEAIAEEAYRGAYRVLSDHRDLLDTIAERLLANEVIEREEIQELMATGRAAPEPSTEPVVEPARGSGARAEALASELPAPPEDD